MGAKVVTFNEICNTLAGFFLRKNNERGDPVVGASFYGITYVRVSG